MDKATHQCPGICGWNPRSERSSHRCSRYGPQTHCPNRGECGAQNDHDGWAIPCRSAPGEFFYIVWLTRGLHRIWHDRTLLGGQSATDQVIAAVDAAE